MSKETEIRRLEERHLAVINTLGKIRRPQNWRTNPDKVEASLSLTVEEAIILAAIARLKYSFPHMTAAMECLHEAGSFADQRVVVDISKQAIVASLGYSKYMDADADQDSDLGKTDTPFNRFATILRSAAKIARVKLRLE